MDKNYIAKDRQKAAQPPRQWLDKYDLSKGASSALLVVSICGALRHYSTNDHSPRREIYFPYRFLISGKK